MPTLLTLYCIRSISEHLTRQLPNLASSTSIEHAVIPWRFTYTTVLNNHLPCYAGYISLPKTSRQLQRTTHQQHRATQHSTTYQPKDLANQKISDTTMNPSQRSKTNQQATQAPVLEWSTNAATGARSVPEPDYCLGGSGKHSPVRSAVTGKNQQDSKNVSGVKMDNRASWYPGRSGF
ncbi:hypothetical protein DPSP01_000269 [Paraphaeosphaeria sporulosa]|uniref:Uncharacterized protein n=1 Tax=Paraphaeosphaeria sporulosa TaxID=1460663 RepID=A0A177D189_9PLEO|nr:uncharacterized protein CC84DRAFT_160474 [Paraphaeosphaeria sporulosa]OAG12799.1 hypothetical protein CC84DRAFT_160474 [Paraphaeosphaeria sporulosa]